MLRRAQALGRVSFRVLNLRDYTADRHKVADDRPFGGGPGMVMKPEPLVTAIRAVREEAPDTRVIFLAPSGHLFGQEKAAELAQASSLLLICGHYEGVDEQHSRFISTTKFPSGIIVLTGGEIPGPGHRGRGDPAASPGCLGGEGATEDESFQGGMLEYPHYTRPRVFEGHDGAGGAPLRAITPSIARWRRQQALRRGPWSGGRTCWRRAELKPEDRKFIGNPWPQGPEEDR